jgi:hypothetical protein
VTKATCLAVATVDLNVKSNETLFDRIQCFIERKERNSLQRGHVKDTGSAWVYSPIGGRGTNVKCPGCVSQLPGATISM